ncbi:sporulation-delaying protein SdpB family protein [Corynebacterium sp. CCM 9204]|uniref:sporulation-delaying protein SdpB family protein n=1 Tax=Corynebacterium sp. CCM 9204 TaxID=3057616 RepID=UPI0035244B1A
MTDQNVPIIKEESPAKLNAIIGSANIQSKFISIGRAIIAVAQLSFILFTSQEARFAEVGPQPFGPRCQSWNQAGLYCVVGKEHFTLADVAIAFGLILVISGFYPRWTGILHLYITYTISTAVTLPDGGESVALIFVGLLAVVSLSDNRRNCYLTNLDVDRIPEPLQGVSQAAIIFGRVQLCYLYADAAIAKLGVADWANGTALYYIEKNALFGDWFQVLERSEIFEHGWLLAAATWMPIALELLIAINVIGTANMRRFAFTLVVILHGGIIFNMGLVSFSLIMIGCCLTIITPPNRYTYISVLSTSTDSADVDDFVAVKADIRPHRFVSLFRFHQAFTRPVVCCGGVSTQGRWGGDLALVKIGEPVEVRMRYKLTNKLLSHSPEVVVHDRRDMISARLGLLNGSPFKVEVISGGGSDPG